MGDLDDLAAAAGNGQLGDETDRIWTVHTQGRSFGPYTRNELLHYITTGQFAPDAMFHRPGLPGWVTPTHFFAAPTPYISQGYTNQYASRPHHTKRGILSRWQRYSGGRSFLFQMIVLGWTALIACVTLANSLGMVKRSESPYSHHYGDDEALATSLGLSWCCMGGAWLLIALPCGIAAIATSEGGRGRR